MNFSLFIGTFYISVSFAVSRLHVKWKFIRKRPLGVLTLNQKGKAYFFREMIINWRQLGKVKIRSKNVKTCMHNARCSLVSFLIDRNNA